MTPRRAPVPWLSYLAAALAVLSLAWGLASTWFSQDRRIDKLEWYHDTEQGDYKVEGK